MTSGDTRSRRRASVVSVGLYFLALFGVAVTVGEMDVADRADAWRLFGIAFGIGMAMGALVVVWLHRNPRALKPARPMGTWSVTAFAASTGGVGLLLEDVLPGRLLSMFYGWALAFLPILLVTIYLMQTRKQAIKRSEERSGS